MDKNELLIEEIIPIGFMKDEENSYLVFLSRLKTEQDKKFVLFSMNWSNKSCLKLEFPRILMPRNIRVHASRHADSFFEVLIPGYEEDCKKKYLHFTKQQISFDKVADDYFLIDNDLSDEAVDKFFKEAISYINKEIAIDEFYKTQKESIDFFLNETKVDYELFPFNSFLGIEIGYRWYKFLI